MEPFPVMGGLWVVYDTGKILPTFYPDIFFFELISTCSILADHQPLGQDDLTNSNSHRPSAWIFISERPTKNMVVNKYKG